MESPRDAYEQCGSLTPAREAGVELVFFSGFQWRESGFGSTAAVQWRGAIAIMNVTSFAIAHLILRVVLSSPQEVNHESRHDRTN